MADLHSAAANESATHPIADSLAEVGHGLCGKPEPADPSGACWYEKPCPVHGAAQPAQRHQERPADPGATPDTSSTTQDGTGGVGWSRATVLWTAEYLDDHRPLSAQQIRALLAERDQLRQFAATDRRALLDTLAVVKAQRDKLADDIRLHRLTIEGRGKRIEELEKVRDLHADRAAVLTDRLEAALAHSRGHTRTDPACVKHRPPRTAFGRWRFNRGRGRGCRVCVPPMSADDFAAALDRISKEGP